MTTLDELKAAFSEENRRKQLHKHIENLQIYFNEITRRVEIAEIHLMEIYKKNWFNSKLRDGHHAYVALANMNPKFDYNNREQFEKRLAELTAKYYDETGRLREV